MVTFLTTDYGGARRLAYSSDNYLGRSSSPRSSSPRSSSSKDKASVASTKIGGEQLAALASPNIAPLSWNKAKYAQYEDLHEELSKQQERECLTLENRAVLLWSDSNDTKLDSEDHLCKQGVSMWRSADLAAGVALSFAESVREVVEEQRRQRLHDPETKEDYIEALGVGHPRSFCTAGLNNATPNYFGSASLRGYHSRNEDALFWLDTFGVTVLGVFDGHGGAAASAVAARSMLHWFPVGWLQQLAHNHRSDDFWHNHVRLELMCTQRLLREDSDRQIGSTGSVVVVDNIGDASMTAHVFWLGDSQVLQARMSSTEDRWDQVFFSTPHDCAHDAEWKRRIDQNCSACKGIAPVECDESGPKPYTQYGKLKKRVGVTRSLGDFHLRDVGLVIDDPSIHVTEVMPGDLLLVGSDGFWDAFGSAMEVLDVITEYTGPPDRDCRTNVEALAARLATLAKTRYWDKIAVYQDDISVLLWCAPSPSSKDRQSEFVNNAVLAQDWLPGGNIGDRCVVLEVAGVFARQKSTCADLKVSPHKLLDLKCYDPDSGTRPAKGEFGECAIPRKRQCFPESGLRNGGCRAGLICSIPKTGHAEPFCAHPHADASEDLNDEDLLDDQARLGIEDRKLAIDDYQVLNPYEYDMVKALMLEFDAPAGEIPFY